MRYALLPTLAILTVLLLASCGEDQGANSTPARTVTVIEKTVSEKPSEAAAPKPKAQPKPKIKSASGAGANATDTAPSGCITVPDVEGKDHQLAQDTMQAAGLYLLNEVDATGQGRVLLYDRNWTTVRQKPTAGNCVSENTEVTLYAKKDGE